VLTCGRRIAAGVPRHSNCRRPSAEDCRRSESKRYQRTSPPAPPTDTGDRLTAGRRPNCSQCRQLLGNSQPPRGDLPITRSEVHLRQFVSWSRCEIRHASTAISRWQRSPVSTRVTGAGCSTPASRATLRRSFVQRSDRPRSTTLLAGRAIGQSAVASAIRRPAPLDDQTCV
jgi:hypothetical protein